MDTQLYKRIKIIFITFLVLMLSLIVRSFYLQNIKNTFLSKLASNQRTSSLKINNTRGYIFDRSGIPFTNNIKKDLLIIKPFLLKPGELNKINDILNIPQNIKKTNPLLIKINAIEKMQLKNLNLEAISFVSYLDRYSENSYAKHVIGYINQIDNVGLIGIEKFYNKYLKSDSNNTIATVTDAKKHLLKGRGYRILTPTSEPLNIRLTLNFHMQQIVEKIMDKTSTNGAIVIEDIHTGDILAMASKPDFDQNNIAKFLQSSQNEFYNKATTAYHPGSVFKIVTTACLLENIKNYNIPSFCKGFVRLGDKIFKCTSFETGGHGYVNLLNAFPLSCNSYFIDLGIKLGYKNMSYTAKKLGLGDILGIKKQGIYEDSGNISILKNFITDGDVANMSIGQGDILTTPAQIADLLATIANNGIKNNVNIVDSILDNNGNIIKKVKKLASKRVMSAETTSILNELLKDTVKSGTGIKADIKEYGGSAGKTGSSETGQYIENEKIVDAWFAGYFPKENPMYSMCVFVKNGKSGGATAAPLFAEIAKEIMLIK